MHLWADSCSPSPPSVSVAVDKQKQRLEELDETDEALEKQYLKISQKEYIAHIEKYVRHEPPHNCRHRYPSSPLSWRSPLRSLTAVQTERRAASCVGKRGASEDPQDRHSGSCSLTYLLI